MTAAMGAKELRSVRVAGDVAAMNRSGGEGLTRAAAGTGIPVDGTAIHQLLPEGNLSGRIPKHTLTSQS